MPRSDIIFLSYQKWKNKMIMYLSKPKDTIPMDISPHNGPDILPTPIPPIYASIPPPTTYKGKCLASSMSQSSRVFPISPPLKEDKKPMSTKPQPSQVLTKNKRNCCVRENGKFQCDKAREVTYRTISSSKTQNIDTICLAFA